MHNPRTRTVRTTRFALCTVLIAGAFAATVARVSAQYDSVAQGRAKKMLEVLRNEIKKSYYDPEFRGIDVDAHFKKAAEKLARATNWGQANGTIAQALLDFNDSHLYFVPPARAARASYGWTPLIVGDRCYVSAVRPGGPAAAVGLKAGDQVLAIQGVGPTRAELWKMTYFFYTLSPGLVMHMSVKSPAGESRLIDVQPKITPKRRTVDLWSELDVAELLRGLEDEDESNRFLKLGGAVAWQMPAFDGDPDEFDRMLDEMVKGTGLILDLRGNGGGSRDLLERLVGKFFDHDVKIADVKGRKESKPSVAKKRRGAPFTGKIVVLIDSGSGSAAEVFARVIQLEKRGVVIGDRSMGAVMQAEFFDESMGGDSVILYGASITNANLIMADGKSLENVGVTPDEVVLPTPEDLAGGRDPALARAAEIVGEKLDAASAGKMFPIRWR